MPMSKTLLECATKFIRHFQPCQLCQVDTQHDHHVCQDCWNSLPWRRQSVQRQEMQILSACDYAYPLDRIIQQYKYEQQLHYTPLLAGLLKTLKYPKVQAIVPMPISTERLCERGYNQSLLLAQTLCSHLKLPIWQPVERLKQHSQKGLNRFERIEDIQQQFQLAPPSNLRYRKVLIVDDVVTTGSSIYALKSCLEQLGCQQVYAVCLAAAQN